MKMSLHTSHGVGGRRVEYILAGNHRDFTTIRCDIVSQYRPESLTTRRFTSPFIRRAAVCRAFNRLTYNVICQLLEEAVCMTSLPGPGNLDAYGEAVSAVVPAQAGHPGLKLFVTRLYHLIYLHPCWRIRSRLQYGQLFQ